MWTWIYIGHLYSLLEISALKNKLLEVELPCTVDNCPVQEEPTKEEEDDTWEEEPPMSPEHMFSDDNTTETETETEDEGEDEQPKKKYMYVLLLKFSS